MQRKTTDRRLSRNDSVECRFDSQNESTERWSELTSTRFGSVTRTFSGLGSSRSTSIAWIRLDGQLSGLKLGSGRKSGDAVDLLFVQRFPREQRFGQSVECTAVFIQQTSCLSVASVDNLEHFRVDSPRRLF